MYTPGPGALFVLCLPPRAFLPFSPASFAAYQGKKAEEKGEPPFVFLLDNIEDPHNLGAIIRTANLAGAHGVIIPKNRAVGLTSTVARTSAGALNYTPVARVTNMSKTIEELKKNKNTRISNYPLHKIFNFL